MYKYAIEIFFSEDDEGYVALVPEIPCCSAFGETEKQALQEVKIALELWMETARAEGREIPEPSGKELLRKIVESSQHNRVPSW